MNPIIKSRPVTAARSDHFPPLPIAHQHDDGQGLPNEGADGDRRGDSADR
jgi:hypothetical protein